MTAFPAASLGSLTLSAVLFMQALSDRQVSEQERNNLPPISPEIASQKTLAPHPGLAAVPGCDAVLR
jgi:hypothetical protein